MGKVWYGVLVHELTAVLWFPGRAGHFKWRQTANLCGMDAICSLICTK